MSVLNRLAAFFGSEPKEDVNALAKSPYINWPTQTAKRDYGLGGQKFTFADSLLRHNTPLEVEGYRYDRRRGKLETLPKKFNMEEVRLYSTAIGDAIRNKVPGVAENITPEIVTAMLLKEGRENLGTNEFNVNDPESMAIYNQYARDYGPSAASVIAAIHDKAKVSKRLGIPFSRAWIGTGRTRWETSGEYASDTENFKKIATDKKKQSLLNFIRGSMSAPLPGEENY
jgi:hypothetical protein